MRSSWIGPRSQNLLSQQYSDDLHAKKIHATYPKPIVNYVPADIYALFRPNPPLEFKAAIPKKKMPPLTGIASYISEVGKNVDLMC